MMLRLIIHLFKPNQPKPLAENALKLHYRQNLLIAIGMSHRN